MEVRIDTSELKELSQRLDAAPEVIRAAKQEALELAGTKLKQAVDRSVGGTGKVASWQDSYIGSGGGYAAVRPKRETWTEVNDKGKRYAVGHVTTAIEFGHAAPGKGGRGKDVYKTVAGKGFYKKAESAVPEIADEAIRAVVQELKDHLEE